MDPFYGNRTVRRFTNFGTNEFLGNSYKRNIVRSAWALFNKLGEAAYGWRYLTQYSSGNCVWASPDEKQTETC